MGQKEDRKLREWYFSYSKAKTYHWRISDSDLYGMLYFRLTAKTEVIFYGAYYLSEDGEEREVKISIVICTYKREKQLAKNLEQLGDSNFFREGFKQN